MMLCAWLSSRIFPICSRSQVGIWAKNRKTEAEFCICNSFQRYQIRSVEADDVPGDSEVVTY